MNNERITRLEASFAALAPRGEELVERFYARLFREHPGVRELFPEDMRKQKSKLLVSLVTVVNSLRDLDKLVPILKSLGERHTHYGAIPAHYEAVGNALVETMGEVAGESLWSPTLQADWRAAIQTVAELMLEGAAEAE